LPPYPQGIHIAVAYSVPPVAVRVYIVVDAPQVPQPNRIRDSRDSKFLLFFSLANLRIIPITFPSTPRYYSPVAFKITDSGILGFGSVPDFGPVHLFAKSDCDSYSASYPHTDLELKKIPDCTRLAVI
jgi:hypothetical protein